MLALNTLLQNRYRILELINHGGMGAVYLAEDTRFGNNVALKETFSRVDDAMLRAQFHREARLLRILHHTSLPRVIDHFIEDSGQFLVMDYIAGEDLMRLLKEKAGPFPVNAVLDWADKLLEVLIYLHSQDDPVVHRDIKPANIKLTPLGKVILLDFGLAKGATSSMGMSLPFGTMDYAPIEQVLGEGTDSRSDLYSLGVTLYHLLTNTLPPLALKRQEALRRGVPDPLPSAGDVNAQVPEAIARVLTEAMALTADDRPPTAARMRELLREATPLSIAIGSDSQFVPTLKTGARRRWFVTIIVLIAIIGIAVLIVRSSERDPIIGSKNIRGTYYTEMVSGEPMDMVRVPAGVFLMGSPRSKEGRYIPEEPQHQVSVSAFYMAEHEVTQAQWKAVAMELRPVTIDLDPHPLDRYPSDFKGDYLPVGNVSWDEAREFCERISRGSDKTYTYSLPTEAQWEYACRATTTGSYGGDIDAMGWYWKGILSPLKPQRVRTKQPNEFGLYDMHGNVMEWCLDSWHASYYGAPKDGATWTGGDATRVLRGGSWDDNGDYCRSAYRRNLRPDTHLSYIGFRVVTAAGTP